MLCFFCVWELAHFTFIVPLHALCISMLLALVTFCYSYRTTPVLHEHQLRTTGSQRQVAEGDLPTDKCRNSRVSQKVDARMKECNIAERGQRDADEGTQNEGLGTENPGSGRSHMGHGRQWNDASRKETHGRMWTQAWNAHKMTAAQETRQATRDEQPGQGDWDTKAVTMRRTHTGRAWLCHCWKFLLNVTLNQIASVHGNLQTTPNAAAVSVIGRWCQRREWERQWSGLEVEEFRCRGGRATPEGSKILDLIFIQFSFKVTSPFFIFFNHLWILKI